MVAMVVNLEHRNSAMAVEFAVAAEPRRGAKSEGWQETVAMVRSFSENNRNEEGVGWVERVFGLSFI